MTGKASYSRVWTGTTEKSVHHVFCHPRYREKLFFRWEIQHKAFIRAVGVTGHPPVVHNPERHEAGIKQDHNPRCQQSRLQDFSLFKLLLGRIPWVLDTRGVQEKLSKFNVKWQVSCFFSYHRQRTTTGTVFRILQITLRSKTNTAQNFKEL